MRLFRLVIRRFVSWFTPIPTAKHTIPRREPSRRFAFWKLGLAVPSHVRGNVSDVLMQANGVVEALKIRDDLLQLRTVGDFNLRNCAFKGAKKSFNSAVLPWLVRRAALMFDAHLVHRQREIDRHKRAIVIGSRCFWFSEFTGQVAQNLNDLCRTFIGKFKRQKLSTAVVNHAKQGMGLRFDADIRPIQRPSLVGFARSRFLSKPFAQLQNGVVIFLAKLRDEAFAHRFPAIGEARVEQRRDCSTTSLAACDCQQTQHFSDDPTGFAVAFDRWISGLFMVAANDWRAQRFASGGSLKLQHCQITDQHDQQGCQGYTNLWVHAEPCGLCGARSLGIRRSFGMLVAEMAATLSQNLNCQIFQKSYTGL